MHIEDIKFVCFEIAFDEYKTNYNNTQNNNHKYM